MEIARKIMGRPFYEVLKELASKPAPAKFEDAKKVFESYIGCNYDVAFDELNIIKAGDTEHVAVRCSVTILDDEGKKIFMRTYINSNEIIFKEDKSPFNLSVTVDMAQKEAFRRCICGFMSMKAASIQKKEKADSTKGKSSSGVSDGDNIFWVQIVSGLEEMKNYNESYKADCSFQNGIQGQIVFWYKITKELKEKGEWNRLYNSCPGMELKIKAKKEFYKGKIQLSVEEIIS